MQPTRGDHILWHEEANEFIKHFPKQRGKNATITTLQQFPYNRHSTGNSSGLLYTHPSAIAMMTLTKHASAGGVGECAAISGNAGVGNVGIIVPESNVRVGNELLTARQRHQRDLFSGELGLPPIPPPPSVPIANHTNVQRTHVGNVVHTFETLAMQRRLAAFKQQQQQQKQQLKLKNQLQQQHKNNNNNTFSKYLKCNNKFTKFRRKQQQQEEHEAQQTYLSLPLATKTTTTISHNLNNNNFHTEFKCKTFNERNKQISQHYLQQMEIDYRKNLFSNQSHVNNSKNLVRTINNNNDNNEGISEGEAGVVAVFDEMLAGFSATEDDDDDDNDDGNDNDDVMLQNDAHVSIININGNVVEDNVLRINLSRSNAFKPTTTEIPKTTTNTGTKQLITKNMSQRLLPIMRKKPAPPVPPPKPLTKTAIITTMTTMTTPTLATQNMLNMQPYNKHDKCAADNAVQETNDFLRGSTLSQSFVRQSNFQHKLKQKAPKPPILPITTPNAHNITNNNCNTTTQLRISLTNPFRQILRLHTKHADSFNLLK